VPLPCFIIDAPRPPCSPPLSAHAALRIFRREPRRRRAVAEAAAEDAGVRRRVVDEDLVGNLRVLQDPALGVAEPPRQARDPEGRSEEHTSELQSLTNLVCRLLLEKKKTRA